VVRGLRGRRRGPLHLPRSSSGAPAVGPLRRRGCARGFEFPVAPPRIFVRTTIDLRAPIDPANFRYARIDIFAPTGFGVGLGLGVVAELAP
jgi:hypothetical protein